MSRKQTFRPDAWDPIKHNEWMSQRRSINRFVKASERAARTMRTFSIAMRGFATAINKSASHKGSAPESDVT